MSSDSTPTETYGSNSEEQGNQSEAVSQLQQQNDEQDAQIEALNNSDSAVDKILARVNPLSPSGYIAQINRNNRDNMIEAIAQGGEPIFDATGGIQGVQTPVSGLFGLGQTEYVGNPDYNPNAGYNPALENVGGNYGQVLGSGSTNDNRTFDPRTPTNINGRAITSQNINETPSIIPQVMSQPSGGSDAVIPVSDLDQARSRRATALANKQSELANAFASFSDDYFDDLGRSYSEFNNPLLSTAYDDAVRGIYDGFKSAGIMSSADLTSQMAGLDAQKAIEEQRLKDSALTYSTAQRDQVNKERQKLGEQLSGLAGGATDLASIDQQTSAIENFDVAGRVNKLKSPNTKTSMDFFSDFAKVPQSSTADPVATFAGTPSPVSQAMFSQENPYASLGIQTPYQGSATKVIS